VKRAFRELQNRGDITPIPSLLTTRDGASCWIESWEKSVNIAVILEEMPCFSTLQDDLKLIWLRKTATIDETPEGKKIMSFGFDSQFPKIQN
jgi:hypothetical protein